MNGMTKPVTLRMDDAPDVRVRFSARTGRYIGWPRYGRHMLGGPVPLVVEGRTAEEVAEKVVAILRANGMVEMRRGVIEGIAGWVLVKHGQVVAGPFPTKQRAGSARKHLGDAAPDHDPDPDNELAYAAWVAEEGGPA